MYVAKWIYPKTDSVQVESFTWVSDTRSSRPSILSAEGAIVLNKGPQIHTRVEGRTFGDYLLLREACEQPNTFQYAYDAVRSTVFDDENHRNVAHQAASEVPISGDEPVTCALRTAGAVRKSSFSTEHTVAASVALVTADMTERSVTSATADVAKAVGLDETAVTQAVSSVDEKVPQRIRERLLNSVRLWR